MFMVSFAMQRLVSFIRVPFIFISSALEDWGHFLLSCREREVP